jgi:cytochrome b subunit of formate dehydrogenase
VSSTTLEALEQPEDHHDGTELVVRRWSWWSRATHALLALSVFGLVLTGMPMHYNHAFWAKPLLALWQGERGAAAIHKISACGFIGSALMHVIGMFLAWVTGRFKLREVFHVDSIVPRWTDAKQIGQQIRYLKGNGPRPEYARFTFWEKFDYIAEVWGLLIIGLTGLVMWFPSRFLDFLPGWLVNAARIFHSYEAILAMGFLFTVHYFNTHLRPEVFPVDEVIFSGNIPLHEIQERYPGWYKRVAGTDKVFRGKAGTGRLALLISTFYLTVGFVILMLVMTTAALEALRYFVWMLTGNE